MPSRNAYGRITKAIESGVSACATFNEFLTSDFGTNDINQRIEITRKALTTLRDSADKALQGLGGTQQSEEEGQG